jgi:hypothetical protein
MYIIIIIFIVMCAVVGDEVECGKTGKQAFALGGNKF